MRDMCEATPEQCRSGEWAHLHEKAPEPLAQRAASAREASRAHAGQDDLCQDFGHGSSRNHAAMGSLPSAGLVRSKNNSMARAGIW